MSEYETDGPALVIAPHPDDETLGCGGSLLKWSDQGRPIYWLIATTTRDVKGFDQDHARRRESEIEKVAARYALAGVFRCQLPAAQLDKVSRGELVERISDVVRQVQPHTVLVPYRNDVHSDHAAVFDAAVAATKTFRAPFVRAIYAYETLSETDFALRPDDPGFRPNLFEDITGYLDKKIAIMREFEGEMDEFPFPRSEECLRALATLRGAQANCQAAEAFMILKEIR